MLDKHILVDSVFIESKKAFVSVYYNKVLIMLAAYGINGNLFGWINLFLTDFKQHALVNNYYSE